jgi:hypothetical protein
MSGHPLALTDQAITHGLDHISSCNVAVEVVVGPNGLDTF